MCSDCSGVSVQLQEERQVEKELSQSFRNVGAHPGQPLFGQYAASTHLGLLVLISLLTHVEKGMGMDLRKSEFWIDYYLG